MSVEKRTDIAVRATLIVLLATLFHLFLFTVVDAPGELFGARAQLPVAALALVAGYVVFVCLFSVIPLWRGKSPSSFVRAVTALLALPLYLFMFPLNGPMSIVGMLWCVLQSHCLLSEAGGVKHARHVSRASTRLVLLSSYGILVIVFLVSGQNIVGGMAGVTASYLFVAVAIAVSLFVEHRRFSLREGPYVEHVLLLVALACGFTPLGRWTLPLLAARQLIVAARSWHHEFGIEEIWRYLTERPAQLLVLSFALVIALGTVVLCLPQATTGPGRLGILEALFTATSATCVTGLVVVETGRAFTMFGQCVILTMIQIGGLGIMTISVFVAQALGRRMGLRGEFAFGEMIGEERNRMAARLLMFIVLVTMAVELCGGCALAWGFHHYSGEAWGRSVYLGVFHSVSAFCNAGFALYGDSFEGFSRQPFFPITLSLLILLGGVGFGVLYTLFRLPGSRRRGPNPHVTIVLWMTVVLCVGGTVALWILERGNSLANMSL
ncbi:MAG: hypothetical protein KAI66_20485, partial [Lentisphaeria bacterium]|nr:hypothetical protein [Lentisphaeria bacterium]